MRPSVGRIVHYAAGSTVCRAALVTEVTNRDQVSLTVLDPEGISFRHLVHEGGLIENTAMYPPGTWHWPERVD